MEFRIWVETRLDDRILERELVSRAERPACGIGPEETGLTLVEGQAVLRKVQARIRPATRLSPLPAEPTARIAAILDAHSLLCRSSGGTAHYATTKTVRISEATSGRVLAFLPEGSRVAPAQSPVQGHAQMAKRQEAEKLDRFGQSFWIPLLCSICQHVTV